MDRILDGFLLIMSLSFLAIIIACTIAIIIMLFEMIKDLKNE